jgi:hypothetical protein
MLMRRINGQTSCIGEDEDEDELPQYFKEERDKEIEGKMQNHTKRKKKSKVSELVRSKANKVLDKCELT